MFSLRMQVVRRQVVRYILHPLSGIWSELNHFRSDVPLFADNLAVRANSEESELLELTELTTDDRATPFDSHGGHAPEVDKHELVYDLFFIAMLAAFTGAHDVNTWKDLYQYALFFCFLWTTWFQVMLYDVHLSIPSWFERFCKLVQLLCMVVFAIGAPNLHIAAEPDSEKHQVGYFKYMGLALAISRLVLACQYLRLAFKMKSNARTLDLSRRQAVQCTTAALYFLGVGHLSLSALTGYVSHYAKLEDSHELLWCQLGLLETLVATCFYCLYPGMRGSFAKLQERMSLMTLIVLGEGVSSLAKACQRLAGAEDALYVGYSTVFHILCAVANSYILFLSYFRASREEMIRQAAARSRFVIWVFLHLPFHLTLVLFAEGIAQCICWQSAQMKIQEIQEMVTKCRTDIRDLPTRETFLQASEKLFDETIYSLWKQVSAPGEASMHSDAIANMRNLHQGAVPYIKNGTLNPDMALQAVDWVESAWTDATFKSAGFDVPEPFDYTASTLFDLMQQPVDLDRLPLRDESERITHAYQRFQMTATYLLGCTSAALMLMYAIKALRKGSAQLNEGATYMVMTSTALAGVAFVLHFASFGKPLFASAGFLPVLTVVLGGMYLFKVLKWRDGDI